MYKKLARIGPISFGIFFALLILLLVVVVMLCGYVLPMIPMGENAPRLTILQPIMEPVLAMASSDDGLIQLAITAGFTLLASFIVGLIMAILYNIVAAITGGIKVKVNDLGYDDI